MTGREFRELASSRLLLLDGATGTELAKRGMPPGVSPELWVLEHPEALLAVQQAYAEAGSEVLYAPTFGANPLKLAEFGAADRTRRINADLVRLSRRAVPGKLCFGDLAPTGQLVEPGGPLPFEEAVRLYRRQVEGLLDGGVDGFAIETMMDLQEARAALIAVRELSDLPVLVTLTFEPGGRSLTGTQPVAALAALQALGADAFGCNCSTGPEAMAEVIAELKPYARIPLVAKPNAGIPRLVDGRTVFDLGPEAFAAGGRKLLAAGANLLGGCCGSTPDHIAALRRTLRNLTPEAPQPEAPAVIGSASRFLRLGPEAPFTVIGERINPTGKKALQAELRAGSLELVKQLAQEQTAAGAGVLDVNLGLAGIDEAGLMRRAVGELTQVTDTPLCIDSTRPEAVAAALRLYPGRALLNSISAEPERLSRVLPIVARYGALPILLPLSEAGVPESLAERIAVLEKILAETGKYGYDRRELVADALIMTISANPAAARISLDFIEYCARQLGLCTVCGLSNVSFGLPRRELVNQTFLGMALGRGLNLAIANPGAPGIMETVLAADALRGCDPGLERYLGRFAGTVAAAPAPAVSPVTSGGGAPAPVAQTPEAELTDAVLRGRRGRIPELLETLLAAGRPPGELVNGILIPALTEVGARFERKEYYLPQLLLSASAMQRAMELLEPRLLAAGEGGEPGPVFLLATVKGDIHDIGKNIVGLLLRNHHFQVIDLGKDVPPERIIAAIREHGAKLVGLSALMTTTMPQMAATVELARRSGLAEVKFIVGGAAVDRVFAESIGAHYAADAMATVRLAQQFSGRS